MGDASFALNEDQQQMQKWLHEFSETVIRPAAHEFDEREEFPWPVLQEAAKAGIYSQEYFLQMAQDPSGLSIPLTMEELFWGDAGIGLAIVGSLLPVSTLLAMATYEQMLEWGPRMFGTADSPAIGALCVSEPEAGSDVSNMKTRAVYDEKTDEWVLNGVKTWITNGGIADIHVVVASVDPALRARGQASFVVGPESKGRGLRQGQKFKKHGIRASHTAEVVLDNVRIPGTRSWAAGRSWTSESPAPPGQEYGWPGCHEDLRAHSALCRCDGGGRCPRRIRVRARLRLPEASNSGAGSASSRRSRSNSPT